MTTRGSRRPAPAGPRHGSTALALLATALLGACGGGSTAAPAAPAPTPAVATVMDAVRAGAGCQVLDRYGTDPSYIGYVLNGIEEGRTGSGSLRPFVALDGSFVCEYPDGSNQKYVAVRLADPVAVHEGEAWLTDLEACMPVGRVGSWLLVNVHPGDEGPDPEPLKKALQRAGGTLFDNCADS